MFVLEVFGKATKPHMHGLLKIQGLDRDKLMDMFHDPVFVDIYKHYLLDTVFQDLHDGESHSMPKFDKSNKFVTNFKEAFLAWFQDNGPNATPAHPSSY